MRVSYPKAMDVWYSICMLFVFGALLEYAFVNMSMRTEKKRVANGKEDQALLPPEVDAGTFILEHVAIKWSYGVFPVNSLVLFLYLFCFLFSHCELPILSYFNYVTVPMISKSSVWINK